MVLPKSKNTVGLGNSLMNDRFGKGSGSDRKKVSQSGAIARKGVSGETYLTNPSKEAAWMKMRSVTEQAALDEFLTTAELAGTDFTAEKMNNVKIIHTDQRNPYLLSAADERSVTKKHQRNKGRLTVPRRPKWDENTTPQDLDTMERQSLLEWRRGLAELQENDDLLMTPFERNLEVWRQLWRVIERSDLVVQIVDARNPLLFRSEDLERYVKDVDSKKRNLLLVNKADMMTDTQRQAWAAYFQGKNINYKFFSAQLAKERNEAQDMNVESDEEASEDDGSLEDQINGASLAEQTAKVDSQDQTETDDLAKSDPRIASGAASSISPDLTRILTVDELEALFLANAPTISISDSDTARKTTVGLVGYPNVGKSSTINALLGAKKVSVSSTPGKTKHFQTIHLSQHVLLCDCPGLVFPNFATTKADLVTAGVLPIDQMREFIGPVGLLTQRIPQHFLEAVYGIKIKTRSLEEGGTGVPTASELLSAYAKARGFRAMMGSGAPDESRAARPVLKDYVNGKLLYCHPPPPQAEGEESIEGVDFNEELYDFAHLPARRQAYLIARADASSVTGADDVAGTSLIGARSKNIDTSFFGPGSGNSGHLKMPFSHQYSEQGKQLTGRKAKTMVALEKDLDPADVRSSGKVKHFKGNKRQGKGKGAKGLEDE